MILRSADLPAPLRPHYTRCDLYQAILLYYYAENKEIIYKSVNLKWGCVQVIASCERTSITLLFIIPRIVLLSSIQPEAETLDFSTTHFREVFRKSSRHVNTNNGSISKQSGNDVEGCRSHQVLFQPNMRIFLQYSVNVLQSTKI